LQLLSWGIRASQLETQTETWGKYRICSNKRPGRLFQISCSRGALNQGGAIIRGEALINNITRTQNVFL